MSHVPAIDPTGIHALEQMAKKCRAQGTALILSEIREQSLRAIVGAQKLETFGEPAETLDVALVRAREICMKAPA